MTDDEFMARRHAAFAGEDYDALQEQARLFQKKLRAQKVLWKKWRLKTEERHRKHADSRKRNIAAAIYPQPQTKEEYAFRQRAILAQYLRGGITLTAIGKERGLSCTRVRGIVSRQQRLAT